MSSSTKLKTEPWQWHLLGLINPLLVIGTNLVGGVWVASGVIYMLGIGPILDLLLGHSRHAGLQRQSGKALEGMLYLHAILQAVSVASLLYRVSLDGVAWTSGVAALSTGLTSGAAGIIVAHELCHRRRGSLGWWLGRFNLLTVLYLHFTTEHNFTHHRRVATRHDPASAHLDESYWWFLLRTVPGQFLDAFQVQAARGKTVLRNPVSQGVLVQFLVLVVIWGLLGSWVVLAFCLQAGFAIFLLEYINYIRHYGLQRQDGETLSEKHSWQSEERWSRWTLLELTRHPAHHLHASEPFWRLQPSETAPSLPSGYYGCFWIALIPPLWKRIMRNRIPR